MGLCLLGFRLILNQDERPWVQRLTRMTRKAWSGRVLLFEKEVR